jgi:hypothetical protein
LRVRLMHSGSPLSAWQGRQHSVMGTVTAANLAPLGHGRLGKVECPSAVTKNWTGRTNSLCL